MSSLYPWLDSQLEKLNRYVSSGRLPSALVISGEAEVTANLVKYFAQALYCQNVQGRQACGGCSSCKMFIANSYPDYFWLEVEKDETSIKIDAIRKLTHSLSLASQFSQPRLAIISQAQAMTPQASDSLLKTLEEPSDNTTLILLVNEVSSLSATIRSRCQQIKLQLPDRKIASEWLSLQGCEKSGEYLSLTNGQPLEALKFWEGEALEARDELFKHFFQLLLGQGNSVGFATKALSLNKLPVLDWLSSWLLDTIKIKQEVAKESLVNAGLEAKLKLIAKQLSLKSLYLLSDQLKKLVSLQSGQINQQLLLENFAINCHSLAKK